MSQRPDHLPDFEAPPIHEVVVGIQFNELRALSSIHAGLFWSRIRDKFTGYSEQPTLPQQFELFGGSERQSQGPLFEIFQVAPMNRYWFIDMGDDEVIQIQRDRLLHNWRNRSGGKYPHFEAVMKSFKDSVALFDAFLKDEKLGTLECNQCEVTYINHIPLVKDEGYGAAMVRVFGKWFNPPARALTATEDANFALAYRLTHKDSPIGRLHVRVRAGTVADGTNVIVLELTARGVPLRDSNDGCFDFMGLAREAIVLQFAEMTSNEMHSNWKRYK